MMFYFLSFIVMVTKKTESCLCENCKCDPCECSTMKCCSKDGKACSWTWCHWGAALRIAIAVGLIVWAFALGSEMGEKRWGNEWWGHKGMMEYGMKGERDSMMNRRWEEWTRKMINTTETVMPMMMHGSWMESMQDMMGEMSMANMGRMLEWLTGETLNQRFLEAMIPHHQAAVDMARYLAGSNKPELVKLGADIIAAQTKEIEQMRSWQKAWGYTK